ATTNYASPGNQFGQPLYNSGTATTSRTGTMSSGLGTSGYGVVTGQGTTGFGSTGTGPGAGTQYRGASSGGVRRAPQYSTQPVFGRAAPRPTMTALRPDLQAVLAGSTRLPSAGRIQVTAEGEKVVLRGEVGTER